MSIRIPEYGQHAIFLGMTGSGKSILAQEIIQKYGRYFLFDTQDSLDLSGRRCDTPTQAISSIKNQTDRIKYTPKVKYHDKEINDYILENILDSSRKRKKNPRIVYIDEIFHLGYMQSFPRSLPIGFAVGRQRGLSFFVSTQRPKLIPSNIMTEASYMYIFKLKKDDDIKFVSGFISKDTTDFYTTLRMMDIDSHEFIYVNCRSGQWQVCNPIEITVKEKKGGILQRLWT